MFSSFSQERAAHTLAQWERFQGGIEPEGVRPLIVESWKRCRESGTPEFMSQPEVLPSAELEAIRAQEAILIDVASPILERVYESVKSFQCFLNLANASGVCLRTWTGAGEVTNTVEPGAVISEKSCGTAGMPLCLRLREPVIVYGPEHYCRGHHEIVCVSSPILEEGGRLLGGISISCHISLFHPWSFTFLREAAISISEQLRLRKAIAMSDMLGEAFPEGILVLDGEGAITRMNGRARAMLNLSPEEAAGNVAGHFPEMEWSSALRGQKPFANRELRADPEPAGAAGNVRRFNLSFTPTGEGGLVTMQNTSEMYTYAARTAGIQAGYHFSDIKCASTLMQSTVDLAKRYAESDFTVLITGESGTGKELFAQAIHNASRRSHEPFVVVNCGALPRDLVQSELFGYVEGAFTGARKQGSPGKFELAHKGTIFLDEIGEMEPDAQVSLLRFLQNGEVTRLGGKTVRKVDVRVLAATNRNLREAIAENRFREDLFHRLNIFPLSIPPLRERKEDIVELAYFFMKRLVSRNTGLAMRHFTSDAVAELLQRRWPGNVRELEHSIERLMFTTEGEMLQAADLGLSGVGPVTEAGNASTGGVNDEKTLLMDLLVKHNGNVAEVARLCGRGKTSLYAKLNEYGIIAKKYKKLHVKDGEPRENV